MKKFLQKVRDCIVPHNGNNHEPHFLRHEFVTFILLLVIVAELVFLVQVMFVFNRTNFLASVLPGVLAVITNNEREQNGATALLENPLLVKAAQMKADDMASKGYFSHVSPDGKTPWYWLVQAGYKYQYAGENLAVNFFESESVALAWMNSPTHRANIVKKEYKEIGIAISHGVYKGQNTVFVVQFFGTPLAFASETAPEKTIKPTAEQTVKQAVPIQKDSTLKEKIPVTEEKELNTLPETKEKGTEEKPTSTLAVLGEETGPATPLLTNPHSSWIERALTSPISSISYVYLILGAFMLALMLVFYIKTEIMHPHIVIKSLCLVSIIIILGIMNVDQFMGRTELPTESAESYIAL